MCPMLDLRYLSVCVRETRHGLSDRDHAFESCFVQETAEIAVNDTILVSEPAQPCADFWSEQASGISSALGRLAYYAAFRDQSTGE